MAKNSIDWSPRNWPRLVYRCMTSFKLATVVLVFMTLITLLGTLDQVENGLFAAKEKYFHSFFLQHDLFDTIPLILPGGLLLMCILFVNMFLGALVKVKKRWRGAGLLISHFGILTLLASGFVTWAFATDGLMTLYPGMTSSQVESYREWQLEILPLKEDGTADKAWVLPAKKLQRIREDEQRVYQPDGLPFDIAVNGYTPHSRPIPVSAPVAAQVDGREVDGFKLSPRERAKEAERNLPGCYVEFRPDADGEPVEAILWAGSYRFDPRQDPMPFQFEVDGQKYGALLAKKSWKVPFAVRLDEFIFERHPGTGTARKYESRITRMEKGEPDKAVEIKMNEPMRYAGYTFFQESYGPAGADPGDEMYSQFAVANNPADQWPLWALVISGCGLAIHFLTMLVNFIIRSRRKRSGGGGEAKPATAPEPRRESEIQREPVSS